MAIDTNEYERAAAKLARLPRAERFEALIDFPAAHLFKVIGRTEGLALAVQKVLDGLGFHDVLFVERPSARGRFVSISFQLQMQSGENLDQVYGALEQIPGLSYIL